MSLPQQKISENQEFIDWVRYYITMPDNHPDREALRRQLVRDWFTEVGPTAIADGPLYYYDKDNDEIFYISFVTVA